jgi:mitogen-activated protein kinase organizer 1
MPTYSIASGSYDGHVRVYDVRMGQTTVDVLAHPVTSVRCSADGNALLTSTLDSYIRMLDRTDGKLLAAFGGPAQKEDQAPLGGLSRPRHAYRNTELRVRSVFAQGDGVVLSGSEAPKDDISGLGAAVFAWDVLTGENVATVPMGPRGKVVSCVAWNERGYWAGGCPDGMLPLPMAKPYSE